jgi:DNA-binding transcriptional LysR family regulator
MSLTQTGWRFLADAKAMVAHAEEADEHLREGQTTLSGHLRLFATIDNGQFIVTVDQPRGKAIFASIVNSLYNPSA